MPPFSFRHRGLLLWLAVVAFVAGGGTIVLRSDRWFLLAGILLFIGGSGLTLARTGFPNRYRGEQLLDPTFVEGAIAATGVTLVVVPLLARALGISAW
jgi:hypothetical protein